MATATKTRSRKANALPEGIVNDAPKLHETFEVRDAAHQGDLILVRVSALPKLARIRLNHQLADGTTQGSRHVVTPRAECYDADATEVAKLIEAVTKCKIDARYVGPLFVSPENPTCDDLSHPEHGNQGFPAGAVIACVYQRNMDAEEREARVLD